MILLKSISHHRYLEIHSHMHMSDWRTQNSQLLANLSIVILRTIYITVIYWLQSLIGLNSVIQHTPSLKCRSPRKCRRKVPNSWNRLSCFVLSLVVTKFVRRSRNCELTFGLIRVRSLLNVWSLAAREALHKRVLWQNTFELIQVRNHLNVLYLDVREALHNVAA